MHEFGAGTHVGNLRDNNEDSYVCDPEKQLWIVADGMGGLGFGEVASAISSYTIAHEVKKGHGINQAIEIAHKRIKEYAETEASGTNMGTTMVLLLTHGSLYNVFWVGDSRAYLLDGGKITQLTTDHSLVQSLIEQGEISAEEAISDPRKNVVTRALGVQEMETVRADSISEKWQPGQKILLCSDGLSDCVRTEQIEQILNQDSTDQEKVDELIQAALDGGGNDNITIILVSASKNQSKAESDTHVPGETDSTLVPDMDVTHRNPKRTAEPTENKSPEQNEGQQRSWFSWLNLPNALAVGLTLLAVTTFAKLNTPTAQVDSSAATNHLIELDEASVPVARQGMPNIKLPEPGVVIQLGLFNRLQGAEIKQQELARQGYVPYIEKKVTDDTIRYAVLLGPYQDSEVSRQVSDQLREADINHFERSESHY
ncbi:MAG: protein phosphatase 2C domain-containing protein [Pseudomonadales bacterium]